MSTSIVVGICAAIVLGATSVSAQQNSKSQSPSAAGNTPTSIACAQKRDEPLGQCSYRVTQDEAGKTTVTVIFGNGFKRELFFVEGKFLKASMTMSGVGTDTDWHVKEGMHVIRVEGQRYEIPDVLIADH